MTTNWPLLWIGLGMFAIGFVLRLYYGLKLKKLREAGIEHMGHKTKRAKWNGSVERERLLISVG